MEFKDFEDKDKLTKFILQQIQDTLEGGITSRNLTEFRNTYVINADDSLDATYPLYVPFNIISEMVKIVSVKVSFWLLPFRSYSTSVPSSGGDTSGAWVSISGTRAAPALHDGLGLFKGDASGVYYILSYAGAVSLDQHTHTTPAHIHALTFGIYEEDNSPTIKFYISENAGVSYNDTFFGGYTKDTLGVEITALLEGSGSKLLKFTSSARGRLSVQIEIKLDIKAR
jgi:hypothetical protein